MEEDFHTIPHLYFCQLYNSRAALFKLKSIHLKMYNKDQNFGKEKQKPNETLLSNFFN